ncbi:acyl-CoA carboxylase subunit epsilon [Streptomyces sp. NBC_01351]|uniref:acyl-CoA carboxylase subunit epsilon n=1 Tax=Streptomyces sp. NBC_01351 TaxID=2903833 RepID=UPI002E35B65B|nr:acyl-CoA carboxylase subunit epsilon [Streptomyces sp. NBC_01351]
MTNDAPIAPAAPTASLFRVERGHAEPEELAAIALVVACCARRTADDGDGHGGRNRTGTGTKGAGHRPGRRPARSNTGCWAGCWACR